VGGKEKTNFGGVTVGKEAAATVTYTDEGPGSWSPGVARWTEQLNFLGPSNTCAGKVIAVNGKCTIELVFHPSEKRSYASTLTLAPAPQSFFEGTGI
jgi:hypothetical protein